MARAEHCNPMRAGSFPRRRNPGHASLRRAFNLVEMLIALSITATLLTATMVALNASFFAYQRTTEVASTHTIGRLAMHRMLALIRTGTDFGPLPDSPLDPLVTSDYLEFTTPPTDAYPSGQYMTLEWVEAEEALYVRVTDPDTMVEESYLLMEGVLAQTDEDGEPVLPFTLEYEKGRHLYRATVDLMIKPDDNMDMELDGDNQDVIRLVASAMPRMATY